MVINNKLEGNSELVGIKSSEKVSDIDALFAELFALVNLESIDSENNSVEELDAKEIDETIAFPWVKRILFDNMTPEILRKNIELVNGEFETEASGNIDRSNLVSYAETGVNYVSMGALTYAAVPADLSLKAI